MTSIRRVSDLGTRGIANIADSSVTSSKIADGAIVVDDLANNAVTQAKLNTSVPLSGFRNFIINGSFDVWQRGSSVSTRGGGLTDYGPDRWRFGNNSTAAQYTLSRVANTSAAPCAYAMRLTSAFSNAGLNGIEYVMEYLDVAKLWGNFLTLSFWVRASTSITVSTAIGTGTLTNDSYPGVGNGLTGAVSLGGSNFSVTTSWQRVSLTTSSIVATSAGQLRVILFGAASPASGVWVEFAGVQLEAGSQPTPFEQRPVMTEIAMCQRYYEKSYDIDTTPATNTNNGLYLVTSTSEGNGQVYVNCSFKVPKRTAAYTITPYLNTGTVNQWTYFRNGVAGSVVTAASTYYGHNSFGMYTSSIGAGWVPCYVYGHWTCSAEL